MKKVLIVEDEKDIREILDEVFRKDLGFTHVTFATDGLEGYTEAYLQKFDLICTDHAMPYCKGSDMVFGIRNKTGINQHTPIIMVSALISEFADKMENMESTYFIEKPIDFSRLSRYVKMAMMNSKNRTDSDAA
ncbi:MAG: response regulator transcription factor [Rhizobacter sp.]|nr:response regulator transcription factor [Bacteriovorax sp.]